MTKKQAIAVLINEPCPMTPREATEALDRAGAFEPPPAPAGLARDEAIAIMRRTLAALAPDPDPNFGDPVAFDAFYRGARAVLRSLIQAGAFSDGRNWADRLPLEPGEGEL